MSSPPMTVLKDRVSIEYLIGLACQKDGTMIDIADVESVEIVKGLVGSVAVFKMRNWQPEVAVWLTEKDLETHSKIQSVASSRFNAPRLSTIPSPVQMNVGYKNSIYPENLPYVINYLKNVNSEVREIAQRNDILDVSYDTVSDTKPQVLPDGTTATPRYRIHVKHENRTVNRTQTTTIYETKEVIDAIVAYANFNGGKGDDERLLDLSLSYLMKYTWLQNILGSGHRITNAKAFQLDGFKFEVEIEFHDPKAPEPVVEHKVKFPVEEDDFRTLQAYADIHRQNTKNKRKPPFPGGVGAVMITRECSIAGQEIPRLTPTKHYDANSLKRLPEPTIALKCKCDKGFFCDNISIGVNLGTDFRTWLDRVPQPTKGNVPSHFYLAVPIFGHLLYSFRVKHMAMESWSGEVEKKFMAYGITEDETFFYDVPPSTGALGYPLTIMKDTIQYVQQYYARILASWTPVIASVVNGTTAAPCRSKSHTYGTSKRIFDMIRSVGIDSDESKALILSLDLYELCTMCYTNANPAFSLLPDLS